MGKFLDSLNLTTKPHAAKKVFSTIKWWEKRRLKFNLIIISAVFIPVFMVWDLLNNIDLPLMLFFLFINLIIGNIVFCLGWGVELLRWHYFKIKSIGKNNTKNFNLVLFSSFVLIFLSTYIFLQPIVNQ